MRQEQVEPSNKSLGSEISYQSPAAEQRPAFGNIMFATEKMLLTKMMREIGNPPLQIVLWNGNIISNHGDSAVARVYIRDRGALLKLITDPELYFGEMYMAQRIEVQGNLLDFLDAIYKALLMRNRSRIGKMLLTHLADARRNTLVGSRRNIQHHYDIGNDFYKLWLDQRLLYTCAYFPDQSTSLEDAQFAKMDHVCRKLQLKPGEKVLEAGCGWGALALHMARHYGVTVQAYNISKGRSALPGAALLQKGWMAKSSLLKMTIATCRVSSMLLFLSACSNMWGQIIIRHWVKS